MSKNELTVKSDTDNKRVGNILVIVGICLLLLGSLIILLKFIGYNWNIIWWYFKYNWFRIINIWYYPISIFK